MTPFYEGWVRACRTLRDADARGRPVDEVIIRPSMGYRLGRSLVQIGSHLMGERVVTRRELDLAA